MLSISKTSVPFNYQLSVSRVYEEGDANILDDDEDEGTRPPTSFSVISANMGLATHTNSFPTDADEKSFLLGVELGFQTFTHEGQYAFAWLDTDEPEDRFEFVADSGLKKAAREVVEKTILQAIYERKFMKSSSGVSLAELKRAAE